MLTAREGEVNIARFLEAGADDYMTKPFSHLEFLGRAQALLRRARSDKRNSECLQAGELLADFGASEVHLAGEPINLTRTELSILWQLMKAAPSVVTYQALSMNALRSVSPTDNDTKELRVHIQHLRLKLNDHQETPNILPTSMALDTSFC